MENEKGKFFYTIKMRKSHSSEIQRSLKSNIRIYSFKSHHLLGPYNNLIHFKCFAKISMPTTVSQESLWRQTLLSLGKKYLQWTDKLWWCAVSHSSLGVKNARAETVCRNECLKELLLGRNDGCPKTTKRKRAVILYWSELYVGNHWLPFLPKQCTNQKPKDCWSKLFSLPFYYKE